VVKWLQARLVAPLLSLLNLVSSSPILQYPLLLKAVELPESIVLEIDAVRQRVTVWRIPGSATLGIVSCRCRGSPHGAVKVNRTVRLWFLERYQIL